MFNRAAPNRRPEGIEQLKRDLDRIVSEARHWGVNARDIADIIDQRSEALRIQWAISAPVV